MRFSPEITELARRGERLTRRIERHRRIAHDLAAERGEVWAKGVAAGASHEQLADRAGVHKGQVAKALARYAR